MCFLHYPFHFLSSNFPYLKPNKAQINTLQIMCALHPKLQNIQYLIFKHIKSSAHKLKQSFQILRARCGYKYIGIPTKMKITRSKMAHRCE